MAVTAQQVKNLVPDCTVIDQIVESIIEDTTTFVSGAIGDCTEMSDDEVSNVIKWLSAHFVALGPCRQAKREKLGEAEVEFDAQKGEGLNSTPYGRAAVSFDRCGMLESASKRSIVIKAITSFE